MRVFHLRLHVNERIRYGISPYRITNKQIYVAQTLLGRYETIHCRMQSKISRKFFMDFSVIRSIASQINDAGLSMLAPLHSGRLVNLCTAFLLFQLVLQNRNLGFCDT